LNWRTAARFAISIQIRFVFVLLANSARWLIFFKPELPYRWIRNSELRERERETMGLNDIFMVKVYYLQLYFLVSFLCFCFHV